jgi:hypothetical protein
MDGHAPNWAERIHDQAWFCDEKRPERSKHSGHSEREIFRSLGDAEAHMRKEHRDIYNDDQISSIAKENTMRKSRPLGDCPLCDRTIHRGEQTITNNLQEAGVTEEDGKVPTLDQSLRNGKGENKRFRLEASTSTTSPERVTPFAHISSTKLQDDDVSESLRHKPTEQELQKQMAKHVAGHLRHLALFASQYSPSNGDLGESSSTEDFASDTVDGNSERGVANSDFHSPENANTSHESSLIGPSEFTFRFPWGDVELEEDRKRRRPHSSKSVVMTDTGFVPGDDKVSFSPVIRHSRLYLLFTFPRFAHA